MKYRQAFFTPPLLFALLFAFLALTACEHSSSPAQKVETWPVITDCNLHAQACTAQQGQQTVTLTLAPRPIPVAKPLKVQVDTQNLPLKSLQVDISGTNMYMGYNRMPLKQTAPNHWAGKSMLAFCTQGHMDWQITLIAQTQSGKTLHIPFKLTTPYSAVSTSSEKTR